MADSPWTGVLNSTGKDDWETPDDLFERYNSQFGFVCDAAADVTNHKVSVWFGPGGIASNALEADWDPWLAQGNIWLNPPYSRGLQSKFVRKAVEAVLFGSRWDHHVVCLLPARTDTKLFHDIIDRLGRVEFLRGRVKFKGASHPAPFPSMIVVF